MKKIIEHVLRLSIKYLIFVVVIFSLQYMYYLLMPMSHWVVYASVEPLKKENTIGDYFYMVSDRVVRREVDMEWNDIMYCSTDDGPYRVRFSSHRSSGTSKVHEQKKIVWRYEGSVPHLEKECYMLSNIKTLHKYGIDKDKQIVSGPFTFKN